MKKYSLQKILFIFVVALVLSAQAYACEKVGGYTDRNCDGEIRIAFLGDSIVYGIGDTKNKNKGGYVLRVGKKLKTVGVDNLGFPGAASFELLARIKAGFSETATASQKRIAEALLKADVVVIDLGRNDRWRDERTPLETLNTLKEMREYISTKVEESGGTKPYIVQAVLLLPNRSNQGPFVKELNRLILLSNSASTPANLRFDQVSKRLLQGDQIHPTPKGYDALAAKFLAYFRKRIVPKI